MKIYELRAVRTRSDCFVTWVTEEDAGAVVHTFNPRTQTETAAYLGNLPRRGLNVLPWLPNWANKEEVVGTFAEDELKGWGLLATLGDVQVALAISFAGRTETENGIYFSLCK